MSAQTEIILIELLFCLGALVALGGVGRLLWLRRRQQTLRPAMTIILCGAGIVVIASLLNVLLFKTYAGVRIKKNQYYEVTSLTANMKTSLSSSLASGQPVSPQAKKASRNVTYLVDNLNQPKASRQLAKAAQQQLIHATPPDISLVKQHYQQILTRYVAGITPNQRDQTKLVRYATQQATPTQKPRR